MKKNIVIYGVAQGSYRTQNLLKALLETNNVNVFYLNYEELWEKNSKFSILKRLLIELIILAKSDIVILPAMRHHYGYKYKLATFLKKKIITDFYISIYDTYVNDRKSLDKDSKEAIKFFKLDKRALSSSDYVVFLNQAEANYYTGILNVDISTLKFKIIPLCVESRMLAKNNYAHGLKPKLTICWWGSYIPLHGIEKIIYAAELLLQIDKDFEIYLFGDNEEKSIPFKNLIKELKLENYVFVDNSKSFNNDELEPFLVNNCDIALGNFGDSLKAKTVLVNKIADSFALGIPVLTMKTFAMDTLISIESDVFICNNTPKDISEKVISLKSKKTELLRIGNNGRLKYEELFSYKSFKTKIQSLLVDLSQFE